jgi:hypothetical protein
MAYYNEIDLVGEEPMYKEWQHTPDSEKVKILEAELRGETVEFIAWVNPKRPNNGWLKRGTGPYHFNLYYRVKPKAVKPSIDWSHVHSDYNWLTIDKSGQSRLWSNKPAIHPSVEYWGGNSRVGNALDFASFKRGDCPWDESLVGRVDV